MHAGPKVLATVTNLENGWLVEDTTKLEKETTEINIVFELDETWDCPPVHSSRKVPEDKEGEVEVKFISLQKSQIRLVKKLHSYIRPSQCNKLCRNCLSTNSTGDEIRKHHKLCWKHGTCNIKFTQETSFRFKKKLFKMLLNFLVSTGLKQRKKKTTQLKGKKREKLLRTSYCWRFLWRVLYVFHLASKVLVETVPDGLSIL